MPKVGTVEKAQISAAVWAESARTLTDFSAEEIFDLPLMDSIYPGVAVYSSATANAFGSWVQLSADVGVGKRLIGAVFGISYTALQALFEVEFGEGASAAEVAVARVEGVSDYVTAAGWKSTISFPIWKSLSDNARLSVRVRDNVASAYIYLVSVMVA